MSLIVAAPSWQPITRGLTSSALAAALVVATPTLSYTQPEPAGAVAEVRGEAMAAAKTERRSLERGSPVFVGEEVSTGPVSRLRLRLGRETTLMMGERARLTIDRFLIDAGGEISLGSGAIVFERPAQSAPPAIRIRSSYGLIAVRGTRFFAGPSNNVFGVFVERGRLTVSAGGRTVTLRTGQGTDIRSPGGKPTPAKTWGQARVDAAFASVR